VDFLLGATLPAAPEATGMALAMSETDLPYIVSFVINRDGRILDGNSLEHTFREIDAVCDRPPFGFMVNCAHPSFLRAHRQPHSVLRRLVGFQANASSLDHSRLDGSAALQADDLEHWGRQMVALNHRFGIKMLGGCCGTRMAHLELLVERAPVFDLLTSLKSRFQADRNRITDAIGSYPAPIPPCDAQFNHLLEERRRLSRALNLVGALLSLPESSPSVIQAAESLIAQLDLFDEDAADRLRSAFQSQRGQDLGGLSDPS
jgi:hypothetical protein